MTASNPFGESQGDTPFQPGAPIAPSLNPYAPPASAAEFQPTTSPAGERLGLPWESEPRGVRCWFRTMALVLGSPSRAFSMMKRQGGLWTPIHFNLYANIALMSILCLFKVPEIMLDNIRSANDPAYLIGYVAAMVGFCVVVIGLYALFLASIGQMIIAAIFHVFLLLVGGGKQGYEATFRASSYAWHSLVVVITLPLIGIIAMIWLLGLLIIGFSKTHEISIMRAAVAVFLPVALCAAVCGCFAALVIPSTPPPISTAAE